MAILWANYDKLYNAFRRNNNYRYGMLVKRSQGGLIIKPSRNIKAIELIDGILYLFRHDTKKEALEEALKNSLKENHSFIKKNLKHLNQSIHLEIYTIRYDEKLKRVLLQPNKKHKKLLMNMLYSITHTAYPNVRIWFAKVNRIMRYLKRLKETSYMTNDQERGIQIKARQWIIEGLTSIYKYNEKEAYEIYKKFAKKMYWED